MKPLHPSACPNSIVPHVRIAIAIVLVLSAVAMASIAVKTPSPFLTTKVEQRREVLNKFRNDREEVAENAMAVPGLGTDRGPLAAEEAYRHRAYPAKDVSFKATVAAHKAWRDLKAISESKAANRGGAVRSPDAANAVGPWSLIGPSMANFPAVLTFSGAPYTTSGRITAMAIFCGGGGCRLWVGAAGGGVWRTDDPFSASPTWTFKSGSFKTNAIGALTVPGANVVYAGTGESNASGDSEAGWGVYKSTDSGDTWTLLPATVGPITTTSPAGGNTFLSNGTYTGPAFDGRAISSIAVDPINANHLYVSSVRAVRGVGSTGGATSHPTTPRPPYGLFESTDGGATFKFIWDGSDACPATCDGSTAKATVRGVNRVAFDPFWNGTTNKIIYGAAFGLNNNNPGGGGVWRSTDGGSTWTQIKTARNPAAALNTDQAEFAVTALPGGDTRMYVGVGNSNTNSANAAHFFRTDDARIAAPVFTDISAAQDASAAPNQTTSYCTGQCWYDNVVYSPPGKPNVVYLGGAYDYSNYFFRNNGRAYLRSTDGGATFTDMSFDATSASTPNGMHPDSHAVVEVPESDQAFFGSDGGVVRSSGAFANASAQCAGRGLAGANLATCQQLLSAVPTTLTSLNNGLSTLQFQSLAVAANDSTHLQGGTQDNGTFETTGSTVTWPQIIYGDGGQSGFSNGNSSLRFNTFTSNAHDVNFQNGDPTKWVIASGPIVASGESALFYPPIIADPHPSAAQTIFQGSLSVWRTQDWAGLLTHPGGQAGFEADCPEFTTSGATPTCGDFVKIGPAGLENLTVSAADYRGTTLSGGNVAFIARTPGDTGTLWVATSTGRVFISKNADNTVPGNVTYSRLDTLAANAPGRFISGIFVDPANGNHAWISYNGYSFNTPAQPGHIFSVLYNPAGSSATWTNLDGSGPTMFPDFPATAIVADINGDVYAANDWGVLRLPAGSANWEVAGTGMPQVEVSGLTIDTAARKLFAATHGRSAWKLNLPFQLLSAASRKKHGTGGGGSNFDINMPLSATLVSGSSGVECRTGGDSDGGAAGAYKIVLHFTSAVTGGAASVTAHNPGAGGGSVGGVSFSGADMIVNLTGVTNMQVLTVTATGVTNGTDVIPSVGVNVGFLIGDTSSSRNVNATDVSQTKLASGGALTGANFRTDVNHNGAINATDVSAVKLASGTATP
jgi:hypothetical protein